MSLRRGLTLIELVVVIALLAVLAALVVPLLSGTVDKAQDDALKVSLSHVRDAIMGTPGHPGYQTDTRKMPARLADLIVNPFAGPVPGPADPLYQWDPNVRLGWRGPYIQNPVGRYPNPMPAPTSPTWINPWGSDYGQANDPVIPDQWGRPIVLQLTADPMYSRLISAGADGVIQTDPADLKALTRGDDIVLFLRRPDIP